MQINSQNITNTFLKDPQLNLDKDSGTELPSKSVEDNNENDSNKDKLEISDKFKELRDLEKEKDSKPGELTEPEKKMVDELKRIDREVRNHEMAHLAAAAGLSASGPHYEYTRGPDNKQYAVGGEVNIDNSPVPGDPEATIRKMRRVRAAALAPADPSPQDRSVAASAQRTASKARAELSRMKMEEMNESLTKGSKSKESPISERLKVEYKSSMDKNSELLNASS